MLSVNEFQSGKWIGQWLVKTIEDARTIIESIKVTRIGKTYNIEHPDGYVIEVHKF